MSVPSIKESEGQIKHLARLYHRKFFNVVGASLSVDDLEQEFWIVWVNVSRAFDPSRAVSFSGYLGYAVRCRMLNIARDTIADRRLQTVPMELDDSLSLSEALPCPTTRTGEEIMAQKQETDRLMASLDPRLRRVVEVLRDMPEEFEEIISGFFAKAELAKDQGVRAQVPRRLTLPMLFEFFGISRHTGYALVADFQKAVTHD